MPNSNTTRQVVAFLNRHELGTLGPVVVRTAGFCLVVQGTVSRNGVAWTEREIIPATMRAARQWLGY